MSEKEISARLQRFIKTLHYRTAALLGEIDQHVHAEDRVHASEINRRSEIHLRERNHFPQSRPDLPSTFHGRKMSAELLFAQAGNAAARVHATLGVLQRLPADIGGQDF